MTQRTQVETHGMSDSALSGAIVIPIPAPADLHLHVALPVSPWPLVITRFWHRTLDGSCTVKLLINGLEVEMEPAEGGAAETEMPSQVGPYVAWIPTASSGVIEVEEGDEISVETNDVSSACQDFTGQLDCIRTPDLI